VISSILTVLFYFVVSRTESSPERPCTILNGSSTMAITLAEIAHYLDHHKLNYKMDRDNNQIVTGVTGDNLDRFLIVIQLDEDGEFFKLFAPDILPGVQHHVYKDVILQTLLGISWETKMLQWEYDATDGEIRAIIEFPLEDSTLTERQFYRCLTALVEIVDTTIPRIKGSWLRPPPIPVMISP
jgi:hypothetical protein